MRKKPPKNGTAPIRERIGAEQTKQMVSDEDNKDHKPAPSKSASKNDDRSKNFRPLQPADEGPWCWQSRAALDIIRDTLTEAGIVGSTLATYSALTYLASRHGAPVFIENNALIAHLAGVTIPTARRAMKGLAACGLLQVEERREGGFKLPNRYTLLSIENHFASMENGAGVSVSDKSKEKTDDSMYRGGGLRAVEQRTTVAWDMPLALSGNLPIPPEVLAEKSPFGYFRTTKVGEEFWQVVAGFAQQAGIDELTASTWFRLSASTGWVIPDRSGKPKRMRHWQRALEGFAKAFANREPVNLDSVSNEKFWEGVEKLGIDPGIANDWLDYMKSKGWKRTNSRTGEQEPIFDFIGSVYAYAQIVDVSL